MPVAAPQIGCRDDALQAGATMQAEPKNVKLMRILDPSMCLRCSCAYFADVKFPNGKAKKMFYCSRLDCDNWITVS